MHDNLLQFLRQRPESFPFRRDIDLRHFIADAVGRAADLLPTPAKIFLVDELEPKGFGFPLMRAAALDELDSRFRRWIDEELASAGAKNTRAGELLQSYRDHLVKLARNAEESSILADYHSVFWLVHTQQTARAFAAITRKAAENGTNREAADRFRYALHAKWTASIREMFTPRGFVELVLENPLVAAEEFVSPDLRELRGYVQGFLRGDYTFLRNAFETQRAQVATLMARDPVLRRALAILGYPDSAQPHFVALFDPRVRQLLAEHKVDTSATESISRRVLELLLVQSLRRGIIWMKTTADGENVADDGTSATYSRAIRPMNFGRRGVVEPIVYRYGLVYDITSFTETLGEVARGGKGEEHLSYRQMLEFQRELADIAKRHGLQFEKFLGDGAFYTSRRATRVVQAAIAIQQAYSHARANGFAFNKGMRIALNYGYYRLLPMQVSADGSQLMEFYGPGIVELSRLTTGKTTKEMEDIQQLLVAHGYDQSEVYRFFAPLARSVDHADTSQQQREFFAYINENGHLINEGIVVSIPFLRQFSTEIAEDAQKLYRLRTPWSVYLGVTVSSESGGYIGIRLLGAASLKGIGSQDIGEVVWLTPDDAEIAVLDEPKPLLQLLQQERNRSSARTASLAAATEIESGSSDLVVCESQSMILVGEWDPVSEEVRRPIQLDGVDAERYGLELPITAARIESQSTAYQKLYRRLSRIETLPSFSVDAIRHNQNFNGFIIGATVEPL